MKDEMSELAWIEYVRTVFNFISFGLVSMNCWFCQVSMLNNKFGLLSSMLEINFSQLLSKNR